MLQRQSNPLNRSRIPDKRVQVVPGPAVQASGDDIAALTADVANHETRIDALEAQVTGLGNYVDDAAAAAGGVAVGEFYRNGSVVMVRVA